MAKVQSECNLSDPRERFVWAFRGIEYTGFPMAFPEPVLAAWSEHLSKCGFVHVSELEDGAAPGVRQSIHYQPPVRGQDHGMNLSGEWVPVEQELELPHVPSAARMTAQEKAKLLAEFRQEGLVD